MAERRREGVRLEVVRTPFGGVTAEVVPVPVAVLTAGAIDRRLAGARAERPMGGEEADLARAIGAAVARRRGELGLDQKGLAARVGCAPSAVSRWEAGLRLPSLLHLAALGRALGCGMRDLLPEG